MIPAIVPACGASRRMGSPKLLLPIGGVALIERVVRGLLEGGASPVVVVGPPAGQEGAAAIHRLVAQAGGVSIAPAGATGDMRATFEVGVAWLLEKGAPSPKGVFLAPGDSPALTDSLVRMMVRQFQDAAADFVVPVHAGKRGHPLLLSWESALAVRGLPEGTGINALVRRAGVTVRELAVDDAEVVLDLDTPEDYRRWQNAGAARS